MKNRMLSTVGIGAGAFALAMLPMSATVQAQELFDGFYFGPLFGFGGPNTDGVFDGAGSDADMGSFSIIGILGGGTVGFNFRHEQYVFSIEGDISALDWARDFVDEEGSTQGFEAELFGTARGRFGLVYGNSVVFLTGGVAILDTEIEVEGTSTTLGDRDKGITAVGGVIGAGIETMLNEHLSFKVEGLYAIFDDRTDLSGLADGDPGDHIDIEDVFIARFGLNWHLGNFLDGAGTVVSPAADYDPVPDNRWSGPYLGASIGFGGAGTNGTFDNFGADVDMEAVSDNGVIGGGHLGWNHQAGGFVFGVEGGISGLDWGRETGVDSEGQTHEWETNWLAEIRGRAGALVGDAFIYGTGGVAILNSDLEVEDGFGASPGDRDRSYTSVGGIVGAGIETFIYDNVSVKAEGLYLFFDDDDSLVGLADADPGDDFEIDDGFIFRLGASWHLPMLY